MTVSARTVPTTTTVNAVASSVITTTPKTRLTYLSMVNNDASARYLAIFDATAFVATATPRLILGPIAASATYVCTNADLGINGVVFDQGIVVAIATGPIGQPAAGVGPGNVSQIVLGSSGSFVAWTEVENPT